MVETGLKSSSGPLHSEWWSFLLLGVLIWRSFCPGLPSPLSPSSLGLAAWGSPSIPAEPLTKKLCPLVSFLMSGGFGPESVFIPQSPWIAFVEVPVLDAGSLEPGLGSVLPVSFPLAPLPTWGPGLLPPMVPLGCLMAKQANDDKQSKGNQPADQGGPLQCLIKQIQGPWANSTQSPPHFRSNVSK